MFVKDLLKCQCITLVEGSDNLDKAVDGAYASDLLSWVMAKGKQQNVFITILNNLNVLGVASLLDFSCVIFTDGVQPSNEVINRAKMEGIPLLSSNVSTVDTVVELHNLGVL